MIELSKQDYNQQISVLHKTLREEKERLDEVFHKRSTFKRNYIEILEGLKEKNYIVSATGYFEIAKKQLQRRDYDLTSILVLLGTLCLLKSKSGLDRTNEFLDVRFLQTTFSIKLLKLLLQARNDELESEYLTLWSMMKAIPVFEEEKHLIQEIVSMN